MRHEQGRDNCTVRARHAGALDRRRAGIEDQAHPAQRQGAARHRYPAGHSALPLASASSPQEMKEKIALFCDVDVEAVVTARDVKSVYEVPLMFAGEGVDEIVLRLLQLDAGAARSEPLDRHAASACSNPRDEVTIGLVGKYVEYEDSYKSLKEALLHGGLAHQLKVNIHWIEAEGVMGDGLGTAARRLRRHPGARRLRQARHRGHDQRHPLRARAQGAVFRHLPGHADHGDRIRAQRLRAGATPIPPSSIRHAAPRHLQAARVERRGRAGRHHAAGQLALPAGRGQLRLPGLRRRARSASATAIATNSTANTKTVLTAARPAHHRRDARRHLRRDLRDRGPSLVSRLPVPSRVQVQAAWSRIRCSRRSSGAALRIPAAAGWQPALAGSARAERTVLASGRLSSAHFGLGARRWC